MRWPGHQSDSVDSLRRNHTKITEDHNEALV